MKQIKEKKEANEMAKILFPSEVGRKAQVSSQAVRLWEKNGLLHALKTESGARVFLATDVEKFLERRAMAQAAKTGTRKRK